MSLTVRLVAAVSSEMACNYCLSDGVTPRHICLHDSWRNVKDPIVLAMYARKGGAGRTIMCLQLAGACAEYGANVLVIDQDPQGSLSKNLFGAGAVERLRPHETTAAIYDEGIDDYSRVIRQTEIPNIAIVPANDHLEAFDNFPDKQGPEHDRLQFALRDFVRKVQSDFDMVLVDTPPNVSNLPALAALNATRYVLTPVRPVKNSCEAIRDIKVRLADVMQSSNPNLVDLGYFITDYDKRPAFHRSQQRLLRQLYGSQIFDTVVLRRIAFDEEAYSLKPITHVRPGSDESQMIRDLLNEIAHRINESRESLVDVAADSPQERKQEELTAKVANE